MLFRSTYFPLCSVLSTAEVCSVSPKPGTALIFNHDTLHEGLPVTKGVKYIIRTEVMYRRVDREMIPNPMSYQKDENYLKTLALYQKSWKLEQGGEVTERGEQHNWRGSVKSFLFVFPLPFLLSPPFFLSSFLVSSFLPSFLPLPLLSSPLSTQRETQKVSQIPT